MAITTWSRPPTRRSTSHHTMSTTPTAAMPATKAMPARTARLPVAVEPLPRRLRTPLHTATSTSTGQLTRAGPVTRSQKVTE
jgi:hypothetical protein